MNEMARYFKLSFPEAEDEKILYLCLLADKWHKKWYGSTIAENLSQNDEAEHFSFTKTELQTLDSIAKEYGKKTVAELGNALIEK